MFVRVSASRYEVPEAPLTFREWLRHGLPGDAGWPTLDDLAYHLTTLFPPVRPRGWLEFRPVDSSPHVRVAALVVAALLLDPVATDAGLAATEPLSTGFDWWPVAARCGMDHPLLASVAARLFEVAHGRLGDPMVAEFAERYVARGRCPADDVAAPAGTRR
jgi:glutamate--cysteine ligase